MNYIIILHISLCLITLGTVIPTVHLGLKVPPSRRTVFFGISGLLTGVMFSVACILGGPEFSSLWGVNNWISMVILLGALLFIDFCPKFSLIKALRINFFMQALMLSALPVSNFFHNMMGAERIMLFLSLAVSFAFVIYNSSVLLAPYASTKKIHGLGVYIYVVLMLLISFEPFTKTSLYTGLIEQFSGNWGFLPHQLSLFVHLALIPLAGFLPYFIIRHWAGLFRQAHKKPLL